MTYTIQFDLGIDNEAMLSEDEIREILEYDLESACVDVMNVKILSIND